MEHEPYGLYEKYVKRPLDCLLSSIAIIALSPLIFMIAVLVRKKMGSPVIFVQERPGRNEKIFKLYKFRTMTDAKDDNGNLLPDTARLTPFGKALRMTSLDELPELLNIIKGDMSIVGPRPILTFQMEECSGYERQRLVVQPGLTCYWQIGGRANIGWKEWIEMDLDYIENMSLWTDIKIIARTVPAVFDREGAY